MAGIITLAEGQHLRDEQPDAELNVGVRFIEAKHLVRRTRAARLGMAAAQRLLRGAEKIGTKDKQFRTYIKTGNYETALADFNSVEPVLETVNPKRIYYGRRKSIKTSLVATVGNTRLILRKTGDRYSEGLPVLEIRPFLDPLYTRIVYETN